MKIWSMVIVVGIALVGCGDNPKPKSVEADPAPAKETPESLLTQEEKDEIEVNTVVSDLENSLAGEAEFMKPGSKRPGFMADKRKILLENHITRGTELVEKYPNEQRLKPLLEKAKKALVDLNALPPKEEPDASPPKEEGKAP